MSNGHDAALLVQPDMQARIARAIASGVQDYIEGSDTAWGDSQATPDVAAFTCGVPDTGAAISPRRPPYRRNKNGNENV